MHTVMMTSMAALAAAAILSAQPGGTDRVSDPDAAQEHGSSLLRARLFTSDPSDVMVMAHRGWWRQAPENSLTSFRLAIESGVPFLEIDVRRTADGRFVVIHDKTLDRTTSMTGRVSGFTLDELSSARLRNAYGLVTDEPIPTLEQAMDEARGRALVYIDKSEEYIVEIVDLLERHGSLDRAVFYGKRPADELRTLLGDRLDRVAYMPKVDPNHPEAFAYIEPFLSMPNVPGVIAGFSRDGDRVAQLCDLVVRSGKRVMVAPLWESLAAGRTDDGAVDDADKHWGELLDLGASIVCTDRPVRLLGYLRERATRATSTVSVPGRGAD